MRGGVPSRASDPLPPDGAIDPTRRRGRRRARAALRFRAWIAAFGGLGVLFGSLLVLGLAGAWYVLHRSDAPATAPSPAAPRPDFSVVGTPDSPARTASGGAAAGSAADGTADHASDHDAEHASNHNASDARTPTEAHPRDASPRPTPPRAASRPPDPSAPANASTPSPSPDAAARPPAVVAPTARVLVTGDAQSVVLVCDGRRWVPPLAPPGTCQIRAVFDAHGEQAAGSLTLADGETVHLTCRSSFTRCVTSP